MPDWVIIWLIVLTICIFSRDSKTKVISNLESAISDLQQKIDELEGKIKDLEFEIDDIK